MGYEGYLGTGSYMDCIMAYMREELYGFVIMCERSYMVL